MLRRWLPRPIRRPCLCSPPTSRFSFFFFNDTATTEIYTLSLHDALPIPPALRRPRHNSTRWVRISTPISGRCRRCWGPRSEEHTSELQSLAYLVWRLLLGKKIPRSRGRVTLGARCPPSLL